MSTADLELFGPPDADGTFPRFTTVLRGYDPDQVRDYILRLAAHVESLDKELEETRTQRDAARKSYGSAKDDAYNQLGQRMADVLRMADHQADRMRREADDEAKQRVVQSKQLAQQIEREAEEMATQVRTEGEAALNQSMAERDRLLGGLAASRDLALADLGATRDHLVQILDHLQIAMEAARAVRIGDQPAVPAEADQSPDGGTGADTTDAPAPAPQTTVQAEDILTRAEGFEIMLPEFLLRDIEDGPIA